jgi:Uncharacterized protein conserved in bacteria (DUF2325)
MSKNSDHTEVTLNAQLPSAFGLYGALPNYQRLDNYSGEPLSGIANRRAGTSVQTTTKGSLRRRLWGLPAAAHCPVIGVCLPIDQSRQILNKVAGRKIEANDYEFHSNLVFRARDKNPVSELLQKELDRRFSLPLQQFAKLKTSDAVAEAWCAAVNAGDVAGALWASLTHARCDSDLETCILEDIHMIQHQAGATVRADVEAVTKLSREHAALIINCEKLKERHAKSQVDYAAQTLQLTRQLEASRAECIHQSVRIAALESDVQKSSQGDGGAAQSRGAMIQRISELSLRVRELEAKLEQRPDTAEYVAPTEPIKVKTGIARTSAKVVSSSAQVDGVSDDTPKMSLQNQAIACIGGRSSAVAAYRALVERCGAKFVHHDGGTEESFHRLDSVLATADLVICQTGCINHSAYGMVKDYCKRTGKRCLYLENPSVSSFANGLRAIRIELAKT